jgi:hypothetical protein
VGGKHDESSRSAFVVKSKKKKRQDKMIAYDVDGQPASQARPACHCTGSSTTNFENRTRTPRTCPVSRSGRVEAPVTYSDSFFFFLSPPPPTPSTCPAESPCSSQTTCNMTRKWGTLLSYDSSIGSESGAPESIYCLSKSDLPWLVQYTYPVALTCTGSRVVQYQPSADQGELCNV